MSINHVQYNAVNPAIGPDHPRNDTLQLHTGWHPASSSKSHFSSRLIEAFRW